MSNTLFLDDHTRVIPHRATSYEQGPEGSWVLSASAWEQLGDGQVQTTLADLARWDANFHEPKVGGAALIESLQQVGTLNDGQSLSYARGLIVDEYRGLRAVSHGGSWTGFRSELLRFPEAGFTVATLCNVGSSEPWVLARAVADEVLQDRLQAETSAATVPAQAVAASGASAEAPAFEAADYTGIYFAAEQSLVRRIELRDGKLWYARSGGQDSELAYQGDARFAMVDVPEPVTLQFDHDADGQRRMTLEMDGQHTVMQLVPPFAPAGKALAAFVGEYQSEELDARWRLAVEDAQLKLYPRRGEPLPLSPAFADAFTGSGLLRFRRDDEGNVTGFEVNVGRARGIAFLRRSGSSVD
jgi:hypothetical protein